MSLWYNLPDADVTRLRDLVERRLGELLMESADPDTARDRYNEIPKEVVELTRLHERLQGMEKR